MISVLLSEKLYTRAFPLQGQGMLATCKGIDRRAWLSIEKAQSTGEWPTANFYKAVF
jgi:hypothetical protein